MDADIDFKKFNFSKAMSIWDCSFGNIYTQYSQQQHIYI